MKLFRTASDNPAPPPSPVAAAPEAPPAAPREAANEASLRDMAEKIRTLTSSLDAAATDRAALEEKLDRMEDRMRRLASLAEMASSQYNPFLDGQPEAVPLAPSGGHARPEVPAAPPPEASPGEGAPEWEAPWEAGEPPAAAGPHLGRIPPSVETSRIVLAWSETLLAATGSLEGLDELLGYYESIGWISPEVRAEVAAYARGLPAPATSGAPDWRPAVEIHERTLLYLEKLRAFSPRR